MGAILVEIMMVGNRDRYSAYGQDVVKQWDIERLYGDLAVQKGRLLKPSGDIYRLTPAERRNLRGLLLGYSPQELAEQFNVNARGLHVELSKGIYRYVKHLLRHPEARLPGWQDIPRWLKNAGYRQSDRVREEPKVAVPHRLMRLPRRYGPGLVGRSTEIKRIIGLLQWDSPEGCVVVCGPGGVGKTTLAIEAAHETAPAGFETVVFASAKMTSLTGDGTVPHFHSCRGMRQLTIAIAKQLGLVPAADGAADWGIADAIAAVYAALRERRVLLVLDNLDPLLRHPGERESLMGFLLDLPLSSKAMVTTRTRLAIGTSIRLDPLSSSQASKLLDRECERRQVVLAEEDRQQCLKAAGGIPLLLVTIAGRLVLGHAPAAVLEWLRALDGPAARQCLHDPLADGLPETALALVRALTLFEGPVLPADAAAVAGLDAAAPETAQAWMFLVERSWLSNDLGEGTSVVMIAPLRQFCRTWLARDRAIAAVYRDQWLAWGLRTTHQYGNVDRLEWFDCSPLEQYWPTLRAIMDWCAEGDQTEPFLEMWTALKGYLHFAGHWHDRERWIDWLVVTAERRSDRKLTAMAHFERGWMRALFNETERLQGAVRDFRRAWQLRSSCDFRFAAETAVNLGRLWVQRGEARRARHWFRHGQALLDRGVLDPAYGERLQIQLLYYRGELCLGQGNYDMARSFYNDALDRAQGTGWERARRYIQAWLGQVALEEGNLNQARTLLTETIAAAEQRHDRRCLAYTSQTLAKVERAMGNVPAARLMAARSRHEFERLRMGSELAEIEQFIADL